MRQSWRIPCNSDDMHASWLMQDVPMWWNGAQATPAAVACLQGGPDGARGG